MNAFDRILIEVGSLNWFQVRSYIFVCCVCLGASLVTFAQVFIGGTDDHWCRVDHWEAENCTGLGIDESQCQELKRDLSTPVLEDDRDPKCVKYNVSGVSLMEAFQNRDILPGLDIIPCDNGWHFSRSVYTSTITEEWELVCDRSSLVNILQSIFLAGLLLGCIVFGSMADKIGRYYTMVTVTFSCVTFGILCAAPSNFYLYAVLRFILGAACYGNTLTSFVHGTELVLPSVRVYFGVILWFPFAAGYFILSAIARFVPTWRIQLILCASPYILLIPYLFFMTESPRWLLSKGKDTQAETVIRKIAKVNGRKPPEDLRSMIKDELTTGSSRSPQLSYMDLIRSRVVRFYTINLMYNWFVQSFVYYGLSLGTSSLGVNSYLAFCISGAVEMPALMCSIYTMKYVGRKWSTGTLMIVAGLACFTTTVVPLGTVRVIFAMIGKFAITASFANAYVLTAEIFPTPLRAAGVGSCSIAARIGGIIAPLILVFEKAWLPLPLVLFASSSVLAGVLVYFLPETKGKPMPDTIADTTALRTTTEYRPVNDDEVQEYPPEGGGVEEELAEGAEP